MIENLQSAPAPLRKRASWRRQSIPRAFAPPSADDVLLRSDEISQWLGLSPHTIRAWRKSGRGPAHIVMEGWPRYWSGEIRRWILAQGAGARQ